MTSGQQAERDVLTLRGPARHAWPTVSGSGGDDFTFPGDDVVALSGDWESQGDRVLPLLRRLRRAQPTLRTVLHVGDLRWPGRDRVRGHLRFLPRLESELQSLGLRLLLTPGNHDDWVGLAQRFQARPNAPVRLSPSMWALPRGCRFRLRGRQFLSFGGAVSVDANRGPAEIPTDDDVAASCALGPVDVLLTHEPPNAGIEQVDAALAMNGRWDASRLRLSAQSRDRIDRLVAQLQPALTVHGHMHVRGRRDVDGRVTLSLPVIGVAGNTVLLHVSPLRIEDLPNTVSATERS